MRDETRERMGARERLETVWAAWCPSISRGRIELGPLVFQTRADLSRSVRKAFDDNGILDERRHPNRFLLSHFEAPDDARDLMGD